MGWLAPGRRLGLESETKKTTIRTARPHASMWRELPRTMNPTTARACRRRCMCLGFTPSSYLPHPRPALNTPPFLHKLHRCREKVTEFDPGGAPQLGFSPALAFGSSSFLTLSLV